MFIRTRIDSFDLCSTGKQFCVDYDIGIHKGSLVFDLDYADEFGEPCADNLVTACNKWLARIMYSSDMEKVKAVKEWLENADNAFTLDAALAEKEIAALEHTIQRATERREHLIQVYRVTERA